MNCYCIASVLMHKAVPSGWLLAVRIYCVCSSIPLFSCSDRLRDPSASGTICGYILLIRAPTVSLRLFDNKWPHSTCPMARDWLHFSAHSLTCSTCRATSVPIALSWPFTAPYYQHTYVRPRSICLALRVPHYLLPIYDLVPLVGQPLILLTGLHSPLIRISK